VGNGTTGMAAASGLPSLSQSKKLSFGTIPTYPNQPTNQPTRPTNHGTHQLRKTFFPALAWPPTQPAPPGAAVRPEFQRSSWRGREKYQILKA